MTLKEGDYVRLTIDILDFPIVLSKDIVCRIISFDNTDKQFFITPLQKNFVFPVYENEIERVSLTPLEKLVLDL